MANRYKTISKNIHRVTIDNPHTANDKLVWLNVNNARKKEIEYLRKKYGFNLDHLRASTAQSFAQRPIISHGDNYLFLILHFPILKDGHIVSAEVDFFISHGYLATIHNNDIKALNDFFNLCKKDGQALLSYKFESSAVLLYEVLAKLMADCFPILDGIGLEIDEVEDLIFKQKQRTAVSHILSLRRDIINFRKIMQSHKNILKKLMEMESSLVPLDHIREYYKELVDHSKTIWEVLENQREMVEVLNGTNESLLNYRLNDIMKTLTIFSVIVFPLTLLAAIFGMNTVDGMPFVSNENGFWVVIIIMLAGCLGMLLFFKKKRWL